MSVYRTIDPLVYKMIWAASAALLLCKSRFAYGADQKFPFQAHKVVAVINSFVLFIVTFM